MVPAVGYGRSVLRPVAQTCRRVLLVTRSIECLEASPLAQYLVYIYYKSRSSQVAPSWCCSCMHVHFALLLLFFELSFLAGRSLMRASTTAGSASVEVSPRSSSLPSAIFLRMRLQQVMRSSRQTVDAEATSRLLPDSRSAVQDWKHLDINIHIG